jgi:UDP-N-acetylmuramoyl-L-alanyl-D-glutamate--2,6-diaminopimelate ligase
MAVYATAAQFITDEEKIQEKLSLLAHVAGRFNIIRRKDGLTAIVDYAHTPDAVAKVLMAINKVNNQQGKVITIVGAGGNRDKTKRPIMAQEAYKNSDFVVLTSDNPRFEDPEMIIEDMAAGLKDEDANCFAKITDRGEAIKYAIEKSNPKDIILLAGKGHEDYQIIQGVKHHFDDREMVAELFEAQVSI